MFCAVAAASPWTTNMAGTTLMANAPPTMLIRYRAPAVLGSWRGEAPLTEAIAVVSRPVGIARSSGRPSSRRGPGTYSTNISCVTISIAGTGLGGRRPSNKSCFAWEAQSLAWEAQSSKLDSSVGGHVMTQSTHLDTRPERPGLLHRHPVATFFALTYATAWTLWLPLVVLQGRMPAAPALILALLGSLMPSTLAIVLVGRLQGRGEVRRLLRRLLMARVGVGWYAAILALVGVMVLAVWVSTLVGAPTPVVVVTLPGLLSVFLFSVFPGSATGEELGWRGFALPRLQARHSALAASLIVGAVWGAYHLPLFLLGSPTRPFALFLPFALSCTIMSIFYTWMYNGTRGSLLLAVLLHAATNLPLTFVLTPLERRV